MVFYQVQKRKKWNHGLVPIKSNMRKIYNKPLILEKMEKDEDIELVSLAHFRGRTFENSVVIIDEFQNLTRSQFKMALGRLGKNSTMIFCGDNQQIDLKDKNYSAIVDLPKITSSGYVYKRVLEDNHRHVAINEVFELLEGM
jgi:phosphate starvation-inducible protein PhoH